MKTFSGKNYDNVINSKCVEVEINCWKNQIYKNFNKSITFILLRKHRKTTKKSLILANRKINLIKWIFSKIKFFIDIAFREHLGTMLINISREYY